MKNRLVFIDDKQYELVYLGKGKKCRDIVCDKCAFIDTPSTFCTERILAGDGCTPKKTNIGTIRN